MIKNYTHDWLLLVAAYHASGCYAPVGERIGRTMSAVRSNMTLPHAFDCRRNQHCSQLCGSRIGPDAYRNNRTLIVYSHHEPEENQTSFEAATSGDGARANLRFFIQEGVLGKSAPAMDEAHFVFVINGRRLGVELPIRPNVQRHDRENVGFEFCGVAEVLTMLASRRRLTFAFFIFLNSSVRGPFYPVFLPRFTWTHGLIHPLSADVKLSGISIGCGRPGFIHLQSFLLATDCVGLRVISPFVKCAATKRDAIFGSEFPISRSVLGAGYNLASTMRFWYGHNFRHVASTLKKCRQITSQRGDVMFPGKYLAEGVDPNPIELMFVKFNRGNMRSTTIYEPLGPPAPTRLDISGSTPAA